MASCITADRPCLRRTHAWTNTFRVSSPRKVCENGFDLFKIKFVVAAVTALMRLLGSLDHAFVRSPNNSPTKGDTKTESLPSTHRTDHLPNPVLLSTMVALAHLSRADAVRMLMWASPNWNMLFDVFLCTARGAKHG